MNTEQPNKHPQDEKKTEHILDQTIDVGSSVRPVDPDETCLSDSAASNSAIVGSGRPDELLGETIGPYKLLEVVGSGGMGTVYLAEQSEPVKRQVALKIIKAGMDTQQVIARFEAERQALSMMEHDNIARVLQASATEQGRPYFVMEMVRGDSVTKFCDENYLPIRDRLKLFVCICDAVQHAHQKGIIHRDLKPSNILVSMQNGKPVPKIIDFGVAKATDQRLTERTMHTRMGQVVGTLEYMSPEQANMTEADVDTRTDIYSLGVVLYELLTGNTPLNRKSLSSLGYLEILNRIKDDEPSKPSSQITTTENNLREIAVARGVEPRKLSNQLRGDLDWIVLKSLEKDPDRRYESAASLADDVERFLNSEPIIARPPTQLYLINRFVKRHKTSVSAGVLVLLTLIGGIVLATNQAIRARSAETQVADQLEKLQQGYEREQKMADQKRQSEQEKEALERRVQRENQALISAMSADVRLKANFGQWEEALADLNVLEGKYERMPPELELIRLIALEGSGDYKRLKEEIVRLEAASLGAEHESILKLWRGYAFLKAGDGSLTARSLIRQAIEGNLSQADRYFAKGLVAESFPEAVAEFEKALVEQPQHSRARMQLVVTLILLGRYQELDRQLDIATALFPEDSRFQYIGAVAESLKRTKPLTRPEIRALRRKYSQGSAHQLRVIADLSTAIDSQFRVYERDGLYDWTRIMSSGLPLFRADTLTAIPVPEFQKLRVYNAYGTFANAFMNPLMRFATKKKKHGLIIDACETSWATHPDGTFKCFEGGSWLMLGKPAKAAEAFKAAAQADSLFPQVRTQAKFGMFVAFKLQYDQSGKKEMLAAAIKPLDEYLVDQFELHRAEIMFEAAVQARRWDLANKVSRLAVKNGGDAENWFLQLIDAAKADGNYGFALSVCDELRYELGYTSGAEATKEKLKLRRAEILEALSESIN